MSSHGCSANPTATTPPHKLAPLRLTSQGALCLLKFQ
ncbi:hypothetical protein VP489E541_P0007 [Vibrio phage 489E54-1]|nr:hypothetical protein VP489E541_P0007 [Vibrio phage 489E54-1]